ncbi:MAG: helix-turn-helix domain-containing protein [Candidatus Woesearchaeota archaeon]
MIVQKNFLMKLKAFGLNSYEAKLWVALLSRGVSTAGELSDIANVPRSRTYDVLESLEKKGFIIVKLGKPIKYLAVPPEEVVDRVKKKVLLEMEEKTALLEEAKSSELLKELNSIYKGGSELVDATDRCGAIKGRRSIEDQLEALIKNAEKRILIHTTDTELQRDASKFLELFRKISQKGVKITIAAPVTKETENILKELAEVAEIRHTSDRARFVVVDGRSIFFMMMDDKEIHPAYDAGIWVDTGLFASAVEKMFDAKTKDFENTLKATEKASIKNKN